MLPPGTIFNESVDRVFDEFGPTPRLCVDYLGPDNRIEKHRKDVETTISNITASEIEQLIQNSLSLTMNAVSHKICLISRQDTENMYSDAIVSPITKAISSRLAKRFQSLGPDETIRLYKRFYKVPDSRATAGMFFEAAGQRRLQDGVTLELLPMLQLTGSQLNPQWYSSHITLGNKTLEATRKQALQRRQLLDIPPGLPVEEYTGNGPSSMIRDVIYVPGLTNQVALDSFIFMNDFLYIFQFSVGEKHDIKLELFNFIRDLGFPSMDKCRFVFVHPPNHTLVCPQPQKLELRSLPLFSVSLEF
jgi:hypothetical protein